MDSDRLRERLLARLDTEIGSAQRLRRRLHAIPELGMAEHNTSSAVADALPVRARKVLGTGLMLRIGEGTGDIWIRAELDALAMREATGAEFASPNGNMHACGHDVHLAALVALARAAISLADELPAPLVAVFQPSEECPPSGAKALAADKELTRNVRAVVAAHVHPDLPWGSIGAEGGAVNAAADEAHIVVRGKGGHAAYPHRTRDPVLALAHIVIGLDGLVGRLIDPVRGATLSVGAVAAGQAANVIPDRATAKATLRALSAEDQRDLRTAVVDMTRSMAAAHGCHAEVTFTKSEDPLVNDETLAGHVRALSPRFGFTVAPPWRSCGGDDFVHYGTFAPIVMAFVGLRGAAGFTTAALHSDTFLPPEEAVRAVARAHALTYLAATRLKP